MKEGDQTMRKLIGILALVMILCLAIVGPALAVKILPYSQPLHDIMHWDAKSAKLIIMNPEGESLTKSWAATVDLVNYDGNTWTWDLPAGGTFAFGKGFSGDVTFHGLTPGASMFWDESENKLVFNVVDRAASVSALTVDAVLDGPTSYYYGVQSSITKSGTDNIDDCTAVTAYLLQTTGAFTVTGRFAPLQVLISGDGTVGVITKNGMGAVHAAWIANRGTQTNTDSILCVHNQSAATAVSGIELDLNGTIPDAFEFSGTVCDAWTTGDSTGADWDAQDVYVLIPVTVEGVAEQLYILAAETYN